MYVVKNYKSPFYQLVYFVNGKRTTVSTKTKNEKEAIRFLSNYTNQPIDHKLTINPITLSKFQEEYLEYIRVTKSKHYERSVKTSFKILIEFSGDICLSDLDLRTLDKFITHTYARTQRGASLYYRTLKAAFSKAVLWNFLSENPFKKIKTPKVSKSFPVFISEIELKTILENTEEAYLKDLFITTFYTGMRIGEVLNMKWSWIDLKEKLITVQCSQSFTTKSKKERIIPINSTLQIILRNRFPKVVSITNNEFVFSKLPGIKLNDNFISKQFKKSVREAKLEERIHFHTLRHSFASLLAQK